jgi:hypothetical protein
LAAYDSPLLADLADEVPEVRAILEDSSLGRRVAADRLQELGYPVHPSAVRRWRAARAKETLSSPYPSEARPPSHPGHRPARTQQWTPGVTITGDTAEIRTPLAPAGQSADDRKLLEDANLDPDEWAVTKLTTHQTYDEYGQASLQAYWVRAAKAPKGVSAEDMDAILAQYINRPVEWPADQRSRTDRILMVPMGDLQIGKGENGGTEGIIERFARYTNDIATDLIASGGVKLLVLPVMGDCTEGLVSQGGRNIASLDLPITAQVRVYRRLMMHQLLTLAPYAQHVLVPVVPGNHDQTTREQTMPHTDSWAIEGASAAADWAQVQPSLSHVSWAFPDEGEPHLAVKIAPQLTLGFTHGHVTGNNPAKVIDWWKGQSHGRQPIGEADILVSAHWHHLRVEATGGGRTWIQIPAMDSGSGWYRQRTGEDVVNGQISVDLTPGVGTGWNNLRIYA